MNYQYNQQQVSPPQNQTTQQYSYQRQVPYTSGTWNARVRPVSSIEEVRASSIDFDGSVFYFPDVANKKIYTKFINLDGSVAINIYELKEMPTGQAADSSYITREEFENAIMQLKMMYNNSSISSTPTEEQQQVQQQMNNNQFAAPPAQQQHNVSPLQF